MVSLKLHELLANAANARYKWAMTKAELMKEPTGKLVVRDSRTGRFLEVRGADAMKSSPLPLKKGIDLTKPIAQQVRGGSVSKQTKLPPQG